MKDQEEIKESSYLKYQDLNDLCGWAIAKLPLRGLKLVEKLSQNRR